MIRRRIAALLSLLLSTSAAAAELKPGDPAPDFALQDQHRQTHHLSDYRGQWLVLYFYPKDDTPGCTAEACSFRDNINRLIAQDAVVLGVSVDDTTSHAEFARKHDLPFPLLADPEGEVAARYGALRNLLLLKLAKRHSFIIDPEGRIAQIYRKVAPGRHVKEVLEDLRRLRSVSASDRPQR